MSDVVTIVDKICEIILSETDCQRAVMGSFQFSSEFYPVAQIAISEAGIVFNNVNSTFDIEAQCFIMVDGGGFEQVQKALEDLLIAFLPEDQFGEMHSVGVIEMKPTRMLPALNAETNSEFWRGAVHFDLNYRVVYTP